MKLSIRSPRQDYIKEMAELVGLFFFPIELTEAETDLSVLHTEQMRSGQRHCTISLSGCLSGSYANSQAPGSHPLEDKRLHKRQVKLALYQALKEATGRQPPWGSLTGIRPTRLVYEALAQGLSLEQASQRMVKLFDVRPENASLLAQIVTVQQALPQAAPDEVDVYIGIPFCPSRCRYCSFISMQVGRGNLLEPYTQALISEIEAAVQLMADGGLRSRAFYMGGGTPTAMTADQLCRILSAAQPLMRPARERTVEAGRPDSMDEARLQAIRDAGVERVSVNPQTSFDQTLSAIGRAHTREQAEQAFRLSRKMGFSCINMDLIAGLPGENADMFTQTLDWVQALHPDNLTVHTLCVKRSSDMHRLQDSLPEGEQVASMVQQGRAAAHRLNMQPYYLYRQKHMAGNQANVGYAKPGLACLYNVDTMEDNVSVLALGAGGISKKVTSGRALVSRSPNVKEVNHYISRVGEMIARKRELFLQGPEANVLAQELEPLA